MIYDISLRLSAADENCTAFELPGAGLRERAANLNFVEIKCKHICKFIALSPDTEEGL